VKQKVFRAKTESPGHPDQRKPEDEEERSQPRRSRANTGKLPAEEVAAACLQATQDCYQSGGADGNYEPLNQRPGDSLNISAFQTADDKTALASGQEGNYSPGYTLSKR
jgi:hypothetical protein